MLGELVQCGIPSTSFREQRHETALTLERKLLEMLIWYVIDVCDRNLYHKVDASSME